MKHGKKERFEIILLKVFLRIARYSKISPFWYFFEILEKQRIYISFKRKIRKRKLQLTPFALRRLQQYWVAVSLFSYSIKHLPKKIPLLDKLYFCFSSYFNQSRRNFLPGIQEKQRLYTLAIENRFLIHYRW